MNLYLLFDPEHYSVQNLPVVLKRKVTKTYSKFEKEYLDNLGEDVTKTKKHFRSIIEFMNEKDAGCIEQFKFMTDRLNKVRKESFFETFPELRPILVEKPT